MNLYLSSFVFTDLFTFLMDYFLDLVIFLYLDDADIILHNNYFKYVYEPFVFSLLLINLPQVDLRDNLNDSVN